MKDGLGRKFVKKFVGLVAEKEKNSYLTDSINEYKNPKS